MEVCLLDEHLSIHKHRETVHKSWRDCASRKGHEDKVVHGRNAVMLSISVQMNSCWNYLKMGQRRVMVKQHAENLLN